MKKASFIHGALLLIAVNFITRIVSFSYDVLLSKLLGAEGIGLFQLATPVMMIFLLVTIAGIPTAVSKLVAEYISRNDYNSVRKIFKIAFSLSLSISLILATALVILAKYISIKIYNIEGAVSCIYSLVPAIIIIPMTAVIRGYCYGLQRMAIASISEIIEHVTRFVIIAFILYRINPIGPLQGAMIAILGISIGEVFDLLWLIIVRKRLTITHKYTRTVEVTTQRILNRIFHIAGPLTLAGMFASILRFANTILIPHKLMAIGYSNSEAVATFGRIMGMAMPLIFLPFIVTTALVINIIPSLSRQLVLQQFDKAAKDISLAIRITLTIAIPLSTIYVFYSEQLAVNLYNDIKASEFIFTFGFGTVLLSLEHVFSGILHGLGKQKNTTIHRVLGMVLQLLAVLFLIDNPLFGINGYFIGFFASAITVCFLDFTLLLRMVRINFNVYNFAKPIIAATVMLITSKLIQEYMTGFKFASSIIIGGFSYLFCLFLLNLVTREGILNRPTL